MQSRDTSYLLDILKAGQLIEEFIAGMDKAAFVRDMKTQSAVIRQLEVIGKATKRLSPELRAMYPDIPWRQNLKWLCYVYGAITLFLVITMIVKYVFMGIPVDEHVLVEAVIVEMGVLIFFFLYAKSKVKRAET